MSERELCSCVAPRLEHRWKCLADILLELRFRVNCALKLVLEVLRKLACFVVKEHEVRGTKGKICDSGCVCSCNEALAVALQSRLKHFCVRVQLCNEVCFLFFIPLRHS